LRAERDGSGSGRSYSVTYRAVDAAGNARAATSAVDVSHDRSGVSDPLTLRLEEGPPGTLVTWGAVPSALAYDVIRGYLSALASTSHDVHLGAVRCIEHSS